MTDDALERMLDKFVRDVAQLETRVRDLKLEARALLGAVRERKQMSLFAQDAVVTEFDPVYRR